MGETALGQEGAPAVTSATYGADPAAMEAAFGSGSVLLLPGMRTSRCSTRARNRKLVVDSTRNRRRIGGDRIQMFEGRPAVHDPRATDHQTIILQGACPPVQSGNAADLDN